MGYYDMRMLRQTADLDDSGEWNEARLKAVPQRTGCGLNVYVPPTSTET